MPPLVTHAAALPGIGEIAALATAACWVVTSLAFAAAGRRVGATAVNMARLTLAVVFLSIIHRIVIGVWIPPMSTPSMLYLAASGIVGLTIGDQFLFTAFVDVGPRIGTLLMTLAPPFAVVFAWLMLDEALGVIALLGIAVTLGGIAWVILERPAVKLDERPTHRVRGIVFGALAAVCQAGGLVLAKLGIGHTRVPVAEHLDPWSATFSRMCFAMATLAVVIGIMRLVRTKRQIDAAMRVSPEEPRLPGDRVRRSVWPFAMLMILIGAIFGPVIGVWASIFSIDNANTGVAATLMAMTPVFILPFVVWIERERLSARAVLGAVVAVVGVGILTLSGSGSPEPILDDSQTVQDITVEPTQ